MENSPDQGGVTTQSDPSGVTTPVIPGLKPKKKRNPFGGAGVAKENRYGLSAPDNPKSTEDFNTLEQAKFLGEGFVALVELVESFVQNNCENKIRRKRPDKVQEFLETAKRFGLQEQDKKLISSSVEKIAGKYEFLTKFAPEFVLGVTLSQYGARQIALVRFVDLATKGPNPIITEK